MKGEFTRMTRRRGRRYSGVRLQQGRVQLDADFNEQVDIGAHRDRVTTLDVIGPYGAPDVGGGFAVAARMRLAAIDASGTTAAVAVGQAATILASADNGANWTFQAAPAGFTSDLAAVDVVAPNRVFAVGAGPAILTRDATTWTSQTPPTGTTGALRGVSFASATHGFAVGDGGLILATTNGGSTWGKQTVPGGAVEALNAVHFIDAQRGWAVGEAGRILATTNGGTSWQAQTPPAGVSATLRGVRFASATHGFAVGDGGTILSTTSGGATWTLRPAPVGVTAALRDVDVESATVAWAAGDGPLLMRSADGGASWQVVTPPPDAGDLTAVRVTGGTLIAGDQTTIGRAASGAAPAWQAVTRPPAARDIAISAGRIYVDGILCENERATRYLAQPDYPLPPVPTVAGRYLAYLDVWERHLTALERPELREVALGGPDSATRTQTVWQLRLDGPVTAGAGCTAFGPGWRPSTPLSSGQMRARGAPAPLAADDCMVAAEGGYRRLENQLYRVEVVAAGPAGTAAVAWSRDNAAMVARLDRIDPGATSERTKLVVSDPGRDAVIGFAGARYVELSDERRPLRGDPGTLFEVDSVLENTITIKHTAGGAPQRAHFGAEPTVRRWDGRASLTGGGWIALEDGVEVEFSAGDYSVGDFWTFPARTHTANVEWPIVNGVPTFQPREGTEHAYCPLALVDRDGAGNWTLFSDCRPLFTSLTGQTRLSMAGGDGQELPGGAAGKLPYPLEVAVMNGRRPLAGAVVRFEVEEGGGSLALIGAGGGATSVPATSGANGVAACEWTLANAPRHRVRARLLDRAGQPLDAPLHFNARIAPAAVSGGGGVCTVEARPGDDLREALDALREAGGGELCLAAGEYDLDEHLVLEGLERVTITGRGPATVLRSKTETVIHAISCEDLTIRMMRLEATGDGNDDLTAVIALASCRSVGVIDCQLAAPDFGNAEQECIAAFGDRADLRVERCRLEVGSEGIGVLLENPVRAWVVASDVVLGTAPKKLDRELVRRAVEETPRLLRAVVREEGTPATRRVRLGSSSHRIERIDDERTDRTWNALGRSLSLEGEELDIEERTEEYRNMLERDLDDNERFGRRSEEELLEIDASDAEEIARIERERGLMDVARSLRTIATAILVRGDGVGRVEIVRNTIAVARTGIALTPQPSEERGASEARALVTGNAIYCRGLEGEEARPVAVWANNMGSLMLTDTRAALAGTWASDPETARHNKDVQAVLVDGLIGPLVAVRHSDIEGFPVGVVVRPDQDVPEEFGSDQRDQMWLVAETMAERGFLAVRLHGAVDRANNYHSF